MPRKPCAFFPLLLPCDRRKRRQDHWLIEGFPSYSWNLVHGGQTGTLALARGKVRKEIYFREGKAVAADSNLRQEALGTLLCAKGIIDQRQLAYLLAETKARGIGWSGAHRARLADARGGAAVSGCAGSQAYLRLPALGRGKLDFGFGDTSVTESSSMIWT